jgi:amidase
MGAQLLGRDSDEATLIALAAQLEEAERWTDRRPPRPLAAPVGEAAGF